MQQILKNLLSNAFKFTEHGGVRLRVAAPSRRLERRPSELNKAPTVVAFEVADTGIGIPPDKQKIIFEAFQQADASTSRKYGGTGLGLAISRELADLLGGEIQLRSTPGRGSTFTLYLPLSTPVPGASRLRCHRSRTAARRCSSTASAERPVEQIPDDRDELQPGDMVLLIVEDDPHYARILVDLAHDNGFKVLVAARARTRWRWPTTIIRPPSRSTCSCPTCSAGRC